jgi:hypothetical protein
MSEMDLHDTADEVGEPVSDEEVPLEVPEADAVEQHTDVRLSDAEVRGDVPPEVDPADRVEQDRTVELDEDDYR